MIISDEEKNQSDRQKRGTAGSRTSIDPYTADPPEGVDMAGPFAGSRLRSEGFHQCFLSTGDICQSTDTTAENHPQIHFCTAEEIRSRCRPFLFTCYRPFPVPALAGGRIDNRRYTAGMCHAGGTLQHLCGMLRLQLGCRSTGEQKIVQHPLRSCP